MRSISFEFFAFVVGFSGIAGETWFQQGHDTLRTSRTTLNGQAQPVLKWSYSFGLNDIDQAIAVQDSSSPIVGPDGAVYVGTTSSLFAIKNDGTLKWQTPYVDTMVMTSAPALSPDGTVVYGFCRGPYEVVAFKASDGSVIWRFPLQNADISYSSFAVANDGTIYFGSREPSVYALNPNGTVKWRYVPVEKTGAFEAPPAVDASGNVYIQQNVQGLRAISPTGALRWTGIDEADFGWATPTIGPDGTIYMAGDFYGQAAQYIRAWNPNGTPKWTRSDLPKSGFHPGMPISADGSTVYTARSNGTVYALNAQSGATRWASTIAPPTEYFAGKPILTANNILYISGWRGLDTGDYFYAVNATNGALLWQYQVESPGLYFGSTSPGFGRNGELYIMSSGTGGDHGLPGRLYGFKGTCTVNVSAVSKVYDGAPQPAVVVTDPPGVAVTVKYNGSVTIPVNAGTYSVSVTVSDPNFFPASGSGSFTIQKAAPVVTWQNPAPIDYGTALSAAQLNAEASITGTFTYNPPFGSVPSAGHPVSLNCTFTPADSQNYLQTSKTSFIDINALPLLISAEAATKVYGAPYPLFSATYSGFVNGDTSAKLAQLPQFMTAPASSSVGAYPLTPFGASSANYNFTYAASTLTITPAPLNIRADDKFAEEGSPIPPLTASFSGLVNSDTPAAVNPPPVLSTTALQGNPYGDYPIDVSGGSAVNYTLSYTPGTLRIRVSPVLAWADPAIFVFGNPLTDAQLNATSNVPGTFSFSPPAGTVLQPGQNTLTANFTPADTSHYFSKSITAAIIVNGPPVFSSFVQATPTVPEVNQTVTFTCAATDYDPIQYQWDFGDGTIATTSDGSTTHVYSPAGTYAVTVKAIDTNAQYNSSAIQLSVKPAHVGGLGGPIDSDGDGYSDDVEIAAGSSEKSAASTPFDFGSPGVVQSIAITSLAIKINFVSASKSSIKLSGILEVPANLILDQQNILVDVGGTARSFKLNSKGSASIAKNVVKASIKKGSTQMKLIATILGADVPVKLADEGFTNANAKNEKRTVAITILFNANVAMKSQDESYTAKQGKSGAAKLLK